MVGTPATVVEMDDSGPAVQYSGMEVTVTVKASIIQVSRDSSSSIHGRMSVGLLTIAGRKATELADETGLTDLMGCIVCQTTSATSKSDEHTLNVLTSIEVSCTSGFTGYCRKEKSA